MPRLTNKSATQRAPQTAAAIPELPDLDPRLARLPGGAETNAALQRWFDLFKQRVVFNEASNDGRFRTFGRTVEDIRLEVTEAVELLGDVETYLAAKWTLTATAGDVVTGIALYSATGPDTEISYFAVQADRFQVNTATGGRKQIFSADASEVLFGDVLTVDLDGRRLFIGDGNWGDSDTPFYVDYEGFFSLKDRLYYNPDANALVVEGTGIFDDGIIGGWTINPLNITGGNVVLDPDGELILGTLNDVVYLSAADSAYRLWVGDATAGDASFRVTKEGVMTAVGGVFSGELVAATGTFESLTAETGVGSLTVGSGDAQLHADSAATTYGNTLLRHIALEAGGAGEAYLRAKSGSTTVGEFGAVIPFGTAAGYVSVSNTGDSSSVELFGSGVISVTNSVLFGSGLDVNLYRDGADLLRTDDNFQCENLLVGGANGSVGGIRYDDGDGNYIAFEWNGTNVRVIVDGTYQGTIPNP